MIIVAKKPENLSFEESLSELEKIVADLEHGDVSLDDALKQFERGIALASASSGKLQQAEQKVSILMGNGEKSVLTNFDNDME